MSSPVLCSKEQGNHVRNFCICQSPPPRPRTTLHLPESVLKYFKFIFKGQSFWAIRVLRVEKLVDQWNSVVMLSCVYGLGASQLGNSLTAGVCRPCVETELTATKKSATDGNWSVTTLCRHKRAYDRIQLVADSCWQPSMFNFYDQ